MNFILCVLTFLSVMICSHPGAVVQETNKTPVGEVVEIGCKKSWRIDEHGTKTLLHRKNDKGRKIFEEESYSCEGQGVLKLIVRSRPVDVTQEMSPYPIGKNAGDDKNNTAGPPGDDLAWLEGSFQLNTAESDKAARTTEKFLAGLTMEQRTQFTNVFALQLISPRSFTVIPESETVNVMSPLFEGLSFKADGVLREQRLADGTGFKYLAMAEHDKLFLRSSGDYFTADMRVEPKNDGQRLAVTRTIHFAGQSKPVSWTAIYDREPLSLPNFFKVYENNTRIDFSSLFETATGELLEGISTERLTESTFTLKVTSPMHLAGAIITGRISKTVIESVAGAAVLNVDFDYIRLSDGTSKPFRGEVMRILSPGGDVVATESDLIKRRIRADRESVPITDSVQHQATYSLTRPLVLDKGSKIQLYFVPTP